MSTAINLLPIEFQKKGPMFRASEILNKVLMVGYGVFVFFLLVMVGYGIYLKTQVNAKESSNKNLSSQVGALETTEQGLVLVRDRLKKISGVYAGEKVSNRLTTLQQFDSLVDSFTEINQVDINLERAQITAKASSSADLVKFMETLIDSNLYKAVDLESFVYTPKDGFTLSLNLLE